jgi:hypothetical protein
LVALSDIVEARARALECAHDARAPFARAYAGYAAALIEAVERGAFGEATPWIARLAVDHAHGWLRSMDSYDRAQFALVPGAWRGIFARQRHGLPEAECLRINLAAHLLYDLPMALGRTDPGALSPRAIDAALRAHGRILCRAFGYGGPIRGRAMRRAHADGCREGVALAAAHTDAGRSLIFERVRIASLRAIAP